MLERWKIKRGQLTPAWGAAKNDGRWPLPLAVFLFVALLLIIVQLVVETPLLILERAFPHGGWFEIFMVALYGAFLVDRMRHPELSPKWRLISWNLFSAVFFLQLFLGLSGLDMFLMTGNLHLPVPMMIMGGPIYRTGMVQPSLLFRVDRQCAGFRPQTK